MITLCIISNFRGTRTQVIKAFLLTFTLDILIFYLATAI